MNDDTDRQDKVAAFNRSYSLYRAELVQLKIDTANIGHDRDRLATWLSWLAILCRSTADTTARRLPHAPPCTVLLLTADPMHTPVLGIQS
jgi:hypothetical protein